MEPSSKSTNSPSSKPSLLPSDYPSPLPSTNPTSAPSFTQMPTLQYVTNTFQQLYAGGEDLDVLNASQLALYEAAMKNQSTSNTIQNVEVNVTNQEIGKCILIRN